MKKPVKLKKLVSRPLRMRYLAANDKQREELREVVAEESRWVIDKMTRKGFHLEATVAEIYGLFTRPTARGTLKTNSETVSS